MNPQAKVRVVPRWGGYGAFHRAGFLVDLAKAYPNLELVLFPILREDFPHEQTYQNEVNFEMGSWASIIRGPTVKRYWKVEPSRVIHNGEIVPAIAFVRRGRLSR